jgi:hypothetical protein
VIKLERLRQERDQVHKLLQGARISSDTRFVLEALCADLDRQIDEELTIRLSPHPKSKDPHVA